MSTSGAMALASPPVIPAEVASRTLREWAVWYDGWFQNIALPLWGGTGMDRKGGGFEESLELNGTPTDSPRRARVQTRQTYVMAMAVVSNWLGPWREATRHGIDHLLSRYLRADGLALALVSRDGTVLDDTAELYDQAFTLLALSAAHRVFPDRHEILAAAHALHSRLHVMRHPVRGYIEAGARPYQANAHMHLLEASLAWIEADDDGRWITTANEVLDLMCDAFLHPQDGWLREFFDADWKPLPGEDGRLSEPGHQFEWAWLLMKAEALLGRSDLQPAADRLMAIGERGVDPATGVTMDELLDGTTVKSMDGRLWPQSERLRACLYRATLDGADKAALEESARQSALALWLYLQTPVPGLWRDRRRPDGGFVVEPARATSLYHIFGAVDGLNRYFGLG